MEPHVLATDLDGTFIPLEDSPQQRSDLQVLGDEIGRRGGTLVFVTGRHRESVADAIDEFALPTPDWIICDVGTTILRRTGQGEFESVADWAAHQDEIIQSLPMPALRELLADVSGLRMQEPEKQGPFKLSYYADASRLTEIVARVLSELQNADAPYSIIQSVDPFNGDGLIDLLPAAVSKAAALHWWGEYTETSLEHIVFAGDSGNDLAAFCEGFRAIVVGNADRQIARQAYDAHREAGWSDRLYLAQQEATSGVLEGCRWFGLIDPSPAEVNRCGAIPISHQRTHFRVWAPGKTSVQVVIDRQGSESCHDLVPACEGFFSGTVPFVGPRTRYMYRIDQQITRPDPVSYFQPDGVHGPSQVVHHAEFAWTDQNWRGVAKRDLVIYELHVAAFTEEGTFRAAMERLPGLVDLGVTAVEMMPVAQTPGRWNWGYDAAHLYTVRNSYGEPRDLQAFVDRCHQLGLAVLLDVVYNHAGPEGNYLGEFGPYASQRHQTPWGDAFNFDEPGSESVRRYIVQNSLYWLEMYHLDGLRLDAVHFMRDTTQPSILDELRQSVAEFARSTDRHIHLIAESNVFDADLLNPHDGSPAVTAIWADCLMYGLYSYALPELRLTDRAYAGVEDFVEALQRGWIYSHAPGQPQRAERGGFPGGRLPLQQFPELKRSAWIESFVVGLQTHDSVGNHPAGKRLHQLTSKSYQRAAATLFLLYPSIPLIFMGEETASESRFPFFAEFEDEALRRAVDEGRVQSFEPPDRDCVPPPSAPQTFQAAKLDQHDTDPRMSTWYQRLLALRKTGLDQGWLAAERMTVEFDRSRDVLTLRYRTDEGSQIHVLARLTPPGTAAAPSLRQPVPERLLLDSESEGEVGNGSAVDPIELQPQHAIVFLTPG